MDEVGLRVQEIEGPEEVYRDFLDHIHRHPLVVERVVFHIGKSHAHWFINKTHIGLGLHSSPGIHHGEPVQQPADELFAGMPCPLRCAQDRFEVLERRDLPIVLLRVGTADLERHVAMVSGR